MAVYACSDIHGNWKLWLKIKDFLKPNDTLYFLGDAIDRGESGWEILKEMLADSRIIYLCGNHEEMLIERIIYPNDYKRANLHTINGGKLTWKAVEKDLNAKNYMVKLQNLPKYIIYKNSSNAKIFMSHSGSTDIKDKKSLLWSRSNYSRKRKLNNYDFIIHGHTPISFLLDELENYNFFVPKEKEIKIAERVENGALWYDECRCDIDSCSFLTNSIILLNLDTFEEIIFEV